MHPHDQNPDGPVERDGDAAIPDELFGRMLEIFESSSAVEVPAAHVHPNLASGRADELETVSETRSGPGITAGEADFPSEADPVVTGESTFKSAHRMDPGERYATRREVGRGGMGVVFKVWDHHLDRSVAMKVMKVRRGRGRSETAPSDQVDRFFREARITAQLSHPGIVPVHELGEDDGHYFFTMRMVSGTRLDEVFRLARAEKEGWTRTRVINLLVRVCDTLAYAHSRGVIHRDLKPSNVMVGNFGETYVMDWGAAKLVDGAEADPVERAPQIDPNWTRIIDADQGVTTLDGQVIGTPPYMPPEQAGGRIDRLDERSDIYSVGALLYEFLGGSPPYVVPGRRQSAFALLEKVSLAPPRSLTELNREAPSELVAVCEKAMERRRQDRYQSMVELAADLHSFLEGRVVQAYRTGALAELGKWIRRNQGVAVASAIAVVVALAGLLGLIATQSLSNEKLRQVNLEEKKARQNKEGLYLAWQSTQTLPEDPTLALLLAGEAYRRNPELLVRNALSDALQACRERRTLVGHGSEFRCAAISPDGATIASGAGDGTVELWDPASGQRRHLLLGHRDRVNHISYSPDGALVVTTSTDRTARIWEADTGHLRHAFTDHDAEVVGAVFSSDGRILATSSRDQSVRLYRTDDGARQPQTLHHDLWVSRLAFHPLDSRILAAGTRGGRVTLWDTSRARKLAVLPDHRGAISSLQFSADGKLLLSAAGFPLDHRTKNAEGRPFINALDPSDRRVRIWRCEVSELLQGEGEHMAPLYEWESEGPLVRSGALSRDGSTVAAGCSDGTVLVWRPGEPGSEPVKIPAHRRSIVHLSFSKDGSRMITTGEDGAVRVWNVATHSLLQEMRSHRGRVMVGMLAPRGDYVLTGAGNMLRLWSDEAGPLQIEGQAGPVEAVFVPPGEIETSPRLLTWSRHSPSARLWDLRSTRTLATMQHEEGVTDARFTSAGSLLTLDLAGRFRLWDSEQGRVLAVSPEGTKYTLVEPSVDGATLVAWSSEAECVELWNLQPLTLLRRVPVDPTRSLYLDPSGERVLLGMHATEKIGMDLVSLRNGERQQLEGFGFGPQHGFFSPDGRMVVVAELRSHHAFRLWDAERGRMIPMVGGGRHPDPLLRVAFTPDSGRLITLSAHHVRIWDTSSGGLEFEVTLEHPASGMTLGPDGKSLVVHSRTAGGSVLWSASTDQVIDQLGGSECVVRKAAFSPDGRLLLLKSGAEKTCGVFSTETGEQLITLGAEAGQVGAMSFSPGSGLVATSHAGGRVLLWPTDLQAALEIDSPRPLTPQESERFEIGTAEERRTYDQRWRLSRALEDIELLKKVVVSGQADPERVAIYFQRIQADLREALALRRDPERELPMALRILRAQPGSDQALPAPGSSELDALAQALRRVLLESSD